MAIGAFLEPLVVVTLLFGGAFVNRNKDYSLWEGKTSWLADRSYKKSDDVDKKRPGLGSDSRSTSTDSWSSGASTPTLAPTFEDRQPALRRRKLEFLGYRRIVATPNTLVFEDRFLSRVLRKFPFLAEAWYWALLYWVSKCRLCRPPGVRQCCITPCIADHHPGIPGRSGFHGPHPRRGHRQRRPPARSPTHPP